MMVQTGILADSIVRVILTGGGAIGYFQWALSVVTIAVIVQFFVAIRRVNIVPEDIRAQIKGLLDNRQYREVIELTGVGNSFLSRILNAALSEASYGYHSMERALLEAADVQTANMLRKIEWLNLIGNVSPMIGLLGTVWGIIGAFFTLVERGGTPDPGALAQDIGVALVTTLLGLLTAIPALTVYATMRNRIDGLCSEGVQVANQFISGFRAAGRKPAAAAAPASPAGEKA